MGGPYAALLEHAADALLVVDQEQRSFQVVNAAAERMLARTRAELLRLGPRDVSDPAEAARWPAISAHLAAHGWWRGEWRLRRKDGGSLETDATVVRVTVGGRVLVQGLFHDRSPAVSRHWVESALLQAQELQHELNNHLALTTGYAELLADNPRLPADLQDAAREALAGGLAAVEAGRRLIACFTVPG